LQEQIVNPSLETNTTPISGVVTPTASATTTNTTTTAKPKVVKHLADDTHFSDLLNENTNTKS